MPTIIETKSLLLTTWREEHVLPYFKINQDPKVIEYLGGPLTMEQVRAFIIAANEHQEKYGYALWAVKLKTTGELLGFIGLNYTDWPAHFTPAVEIGWRLGSQYWGKGYAIEGARAALNYGFNRCNIEEIVSFTVPTNVRSIRLMEKLGLERVFNGDFEHPKLRIGHPLSHHVLYKLTRDKFFN